MAQELYLKATRARERVGVLRAMKELVDLICADKRTKVTPELLAAVLKEAAAGKGTADLSEQFELSSPTIRKILKGQHNVAARR